jgi:heme oxygenase
MEAFTEQVTAEAPSATPDTSADVSSDLGTTTGATATPEQGAAQPDMPAVSEADASPAADEDPYALSTEETAARTIARERFDSLHSGYKTLEADHRTLRTEYDQFQEQLAAFDAFGGLEQATEIFKGLTSPATDANGQPILDSNNQPVYDTSSFIENLEALDPNITWNLAYDLMTKQEDACKQLAQHLGWIPDAAAQPQTQLPVEPAISAAGLQFVQQAFPQQGEQFQAAFKAMPEAVQEAVTKLLEENDPAKDAQAYQILKKEADSQAYEQEKTAQAAQAKQRVEEGARQFQQETVSHIRQKLRESNSAAFAEISNQLAAQVTFSSDPATNRAQTSAVKSFLSTLANPEQREFLADDLKDMGISVPDGFWDKSQRLAEAEAEIAGFERVLEGINKGGELKDKMIEMRNRGGGLKAYNEARAFVQRERPFVLAQYNKIALTYSKAITGTLSQQGNVEKAIGAANASRPVVQGQGVAGDNRGKFVPPPGVRPFTTAWIEAERAFKAGA